VFRIYLALMLASATVLVTATVGGQTYRTITVQDGGTIRGTVKWDGALPRVPTLAISKDPQICDPASHKTRDLERILQMKSSDATLHTVHMDGAATYNLPFPFPNQVISRQMSTPGLVNLKCNGGHTWMNAELFVVPHPYYAVTDETGKFELSNVPAGEYTLVAWHESWTVARQEGSFDVLTERRVDRPVFTPPRIWEQKVNVEPHREATVSFVIGQK